MSKIVERAGFIISDVKFEFGEDQKGNILLGDSLGPDEYRLWLKTSYQPGKIQEATTRSCCVTGLSRLDLRIR